MNQERILKILVEPKVTEKSARLSEQHGQYMFRVLNDASKPEIKAAVEHLFKVEVSSVTTAVVKPRTRRFRNRIGVRSAWKKAFVSLKDGFEIDFMGAD